MSKIIQIVDDKNFLYNGDIKYKLYGAYQYAGLITVDSLNPSHSSLFIKSSPYSIIIKDVNGKIILEGSDGLVSPNDLVIAINNIVSFRANNIPSLPTIISEQIRRFRTRTNYVLNDDIEGRDATVLFPESVFNGIDSKVELRDLYGTNTIIDCIDVEVFIIDAGLDVYAPGYFCSRYAGAGINRRGGEIRMLVKLTTGDFISHNVIAQDNSKYRVRAKNGLAEFFINDILIHSESYTSTLDNARKDWGVGTSDIDSATASDYLQGSLKDVIVRDVDENIIIRIPLPHLGIGFKPNAIDPIKWDTIDLATTPEAKALLPKEGFSTEGSDWLMKYGCVERAPELVVNGDFSDGLNGWTSGRSNVSVIDGVLNLEVTGTPNAYIKTSAINFIEGERYSFNINNLTNANISVRADELVASDVIANTVVDGITVITALKTANVGLNVFTNEDIGYEGLIDNISLKPYNNFIPNKPDGTSAYPLIEGDTEIIPSAFLNNTPFMLDMIGNSSVDDMLIQGDVIYNSGDWSYIDGVFTKLTNNNTSISYAVDIIKDKRYVIVIDSSILTYIWAGSEFTPTNINSGTTVVTANSDYGSISFGSSHIIGETLKIISLKELVIEYAFFDKSNTVIWKNEVRASDYYDSDNPFNWHYLELTQEFIDANIEDAYKDRLFNKITDNQWRDIFLYLNSLTGDNLTEVRNYLEE